MSATDAGDDLPNEFDRLSRLRNDSVTRRAWQSANIFLGTQDDCVRKISDQSLNFDVAGFTNDDGKNPAATRRFSCIVRMLHERASGVRHFKSGGAPLRAFRIRRTVRGDHHAAARSAEVRDRVAASRSLACSRSRTIGLCTSSPRMVSWPFAAELFRLGDGVAHSEAHTEIFRDE